MKRTLAFATACALVLCLAGCGIIKEKIPEAILDAVEQGEQPAASQSPSVGGEAEQIENRIAISIDNTKYGKGERIEVTMNFADVDQDNAVIVIVQSDMPHGQLTPTEEDCEELRWLSDFSEIPFYLWAPEKDGLFDVRVYSSGNGEELASITIAVGSAVLPQGGGNGPGNTPVVLVNDSVSTYSQAYKNYEAVYSAMIAAYDAILEPHNESIAQSNQSYWDDPNHFSDMVNHFINIPIAFTATFGDSNYEASVAAMFEMFEMENGTIEQIDSSNYRMTYTGVYNDPNTFESFEGAPYEALCGFDAGIGALYFREYVIVDGRKKHDSFIEFVRLVGGRYALQSKYERGIVEMLNGEAIAYDYAAFKGEFDPEADSIFPGGTETDAAWITAGSEMYQHITLTGESLHIWADEMIGSLMEAPVRDITIAR